MQLMSSGIGCGPSRILQRPRDQIGAEKGEAPGRAFIRLLAGDEGAHRRDMRRILGQREKRNPRAKRQRDIGEDQPGVSHTSSLAVIPCGHWQGIPLWAVNG